MTQTAATTLPFFFKTVQRGDSVTLGCLLATDRISFKAWFKQSTGFIPQVIAYSDMYLEKATFHNEFKDDPRFAVKADNHFQLTISGAEPSDSAAYYCGSLYLKKWQFGNGTFVMVRGSESVNRTVEQQPASVFVQPGDSVTLQCTIHTETCAGEHSVHWFRHGSGEALPGLIYTHGNRSDPCESSSEPGLPAQGCVYEIPKRNLRSSDAGTYYCAVSTCGQILFGNGTRLDIAGRIF
ncbi:KV03 protein, partial [Amia calva]|nr:KV03 protein [Amia calva]